MDQFLFSTDWNCNLLIMLHVVFFSRSLSYEALDKIDEALAGNYITSLSTDDVLEFISRELML